MKKNGILAWKFTKRKKNGKVPQNQFITPYLFSNILYCKSCNEKLKGKNYSSGKKRKDGTSYGGRVYVCPSCKQKWDVEKVHSDLIEDVLKGWHYYYFMKKKDTLQHDIMIEIQNDINEIDKIIESFTKELMSYNEKLTEVEAKQKALMESNREPMNFNMH